MADPRFFKNTGPHSLADILAVSEASVKDDISTEDHLIMDVMPLSDAEPNHVSFLDNRKYSQELTQTKAGYCFVRSEDVKHVPNGTLPLVTDQPYIAYALTAQLFYPKQTAQAQIAATAQISDSAEIGQGCDIGHNVVISAGVKIGAGVIIEANSVISENVTIGDQTHIGSNATISHADIGNSCQIHPGVRIGQRGFGFAMSPKGHVEVPQLGRVVIGYGCEIGANTTIDRGAGPDTIIGDGTRIDNLVQIGHNVQTGTNCVIVAQSGISGSTKLGHFAVIAAQVGIAGHLKIDDGAVCVARAGVMRDVGKKEHVGGTPAIPHKQWLKQQAFLTRQVSKTAKK